MLQNVIDFDSAGRTFGTARNRAQLLMFCFTDFAAAFPSVAHTWLEDTWSAAGFPEGLVTFLLVLYELNIAVSPYADGILFLFIFGCGVLQGCPLSGALYVVGTDAALRALDSRLRALGLGLVRAAADDIGAALNDIRGLGVMRPIFIILVRAARLSLKPLKCVLVPLATKCTPHTRKIIRQWLVSHCPSWVHFEIKGSARYLGFILGPEAGESCWGWDLPLIKFKGRTSTIAASAAPAVLTTAMFNQRAVPVLQFVAQLCPPPWSLRRAETWACNKVLWFPFGVLHAGAATVLADVGCLNFISASDACWSALVRVAVAGKVSWRDGWD